MGVVLYTEREDQILRTGFASSEGLRCCLSRSPSYKTPVLSGQDLHLF